MIAEDKEGKPVTDLRLNDFQLRDNGSSQDIRLFLNESERSTVALPPLPPVHVHQPGRNPGPTGTADIR